MTSHNLHQYANFFLMRNPIAHYRPSIFGISTPQVLGVFLIVVNSWFMTGQALGQWGNLDADARTTPWSSISRLALEGGSFPPAYRTVSENEISSLLAGIQEQAISRNARAFADDSEYARLVFLQDRYLQGGNGLVLRGCPCRENPVFFRLSGRILGGYSEMGNPVPFEGGLSFAPGHNLFFEPSMELAVGSFWSVVNFRFGGRTISGGREFEGASAVSDPLAWPNWPIPTGKFEVHEARLKGGAWTGQITRAMVGTQKGNWSLSAGWDHHRTGPGLTGSLNLDYQGQAFPAITARRTSPFQWNSFMSYVDPEYLLLRAGQLTERTVKWSDAYGRQQKEAKPYFFQWLIGWDITSWFRTTLSHTVLATAREGTLWPDLLQINFPLIGTTWRETDSGPITDRIFAAQMEFRWRDAPWPVLPASAGRLFWDYGGTDFLPSGPGGMIPQISIPASVAGFELLSPRWDLAFEYSELQHSKVLWYSNSGYSQGYSQDQSLMGHPLGGSGKSLTSLIRIRPPHWGLQLELMGKWATWGMKHYTPGTGEAHTLALTLTRTPLEKGDAKHNSSSPLLWEVITEWSRELADQGHYSDSPGVDSAEQRDWWRIIFKVGI